MAYHETLSGRRVFYENDNGEWAMYTGEARYAYFFDLIGAKWIKDERRYYLGDTLSYLKSDCRGKEQEHRADKTH